jgi:hypothetical protein
MLRMLLLLLLLRRSLARPLIVPEVQLVLQVVRGHKVLEVLLREDQGVQLPVQLEDLQLQVVQFFLFLADFSGEFCYEYYCRQLYCVYSVDGYMHRSD